MISYFQQILLCLTFNTGPFDFPSLIFQQLKIEGFHVSRWMNRYNEAVEQYKTWISEVRVALGYWIYIYIQFRYQIKYTRPVVYYATFILKRKSSVYNNYVQWYSDTLHSHLDIILMITF